jgi:beta-phosphoglucomutase-like phosphatase (HAD superfamily)
MTISSLLPRLSEEEIEDEVNRVRSAALESAKNVVMLPGAKRLIAELPADRWAIVTSNDREVAVSTLAGVTARVGNGDVILTISSPKGCWVAP